MEYFYQYQHLQDDTNCLTLINDIADIEYKTINDKQIPIINYIFDINKIYFITFSIDSETFSPFSLKLTELNDNSNFLENIYEQCDQFQFFQANYACIFSPLRDKKYNTIYWDFENNIISQIDNIKIYEVNPIPFFDFIDNIKSINKIAIQGTPGTYININHNSFQIPMEGIFELPYGIEIESVGIASTDHFIIDLIYTT